MDPRMPYICCVGKNSCLPVLANDKAGASKHCGSDSPNCFCLSLLLPYPYLISAPIFYPFSIEFLLKSLCLLSSSHLQRHRAPESLIDYTTISLSLGSTKPNTIIITIIDIQTSLQYPFSGATANAGQTNVELQHYETVV